MTCEYNSKPCDECRRKYCPDMVASIKSEMEDLQISVLAAENELMALKCKLASYKSKYNNLDAEYKIISLK